MFTKESLWSLLDQIHILESSDLHISSGRSPFIRDKSGNIVLLEGEWVIAESEIESTLRDILPASKTEEYKTLGETDFSYCAGARRYRMNAFRDISGTSLAIRVIPEVIPNVESMGFTQEIINLTKKESGLVLVTGPTGSGKSTTLASLIEYINQNQQKHIITIEDPIEYSFHSKKCLIHQREVWSHTSSFAKAIRSALREDPDIILVGEMRDPETIQAALTLAETGHLVFSTLHTNDAIQSIDRIIDAFPSGQQNQIRTQLSMSLTAVIAQVLIPKADNTGRVAARELLLSNDAVKSCIAKSQTHALYSVLELSRQEGMYSFEIYLDYLLWKGIISQETKERHTKNSSPKS